MNKLKILPNDIHSEDAVLGSILLRPKCLPEVAKLISPESFYSKTNSIIYDAILELHKDNLPIDILTVSKLVQKNHSDISISTISSLMDTVPASTNANHYAMEVSKHKTCRDIIDMGNKITELGYNSDYDSIPTTLASLQKDFVKKTNKEDNITNVIKEFEARTKLYEEKRKLGLDLIGIPSGYSKIDKVIDGLREGHFWVIGAYTSMGKSSLALNIASNLIKQGKRVVFYSLEMTPVDILSRLLGIMNNESGKDIIKGFPKDEKAIEVSKQAIINSGFSIKSGVSEISEIIMSMYEETTIKPVDLFIVDYIQNVSLRGSKSEYETTSKVALDLQLSAQRFNIPIIGLSQVSNESVREKDSQQLMGYKGSGAIAASADFAIEIKLREENNEDRIRKLQAREPVMMRFVLKKNRHGEVGFVDVLFDGVTGIFTQDVGLDNF